MQKGVIIHALHIPTDMHVAQLQYFKPWKCEYEHLGQRYSPNPMTQFNVNVMLLYTHKNRIKRKTRSTKHQSNRVNAHESTQLLSTI